MTRFLPLFGVRAASLLLAGGKKTLRALGLRVASLPCPSVVGMRVTRLYTGAALGPTASVSEAAALLFPIIRLALVFRKKCRCRWYVSHNAGKKKEGKIAWCSWLLDEGLQLPLLVHESGAGRLSRSASAWTISPVRFS